MTEVRSSRNIARSVIGTTSASGYVDGPVSEIDTSATYTFEAKIDDSWYRWTDQRPEIDSDRFRFHLRDGTPISPPADAD